MNIFKLESMYLRYIDTTAGCVTYFSETNYEDYGLAFSNKGGFSFVADLRFFPDGKPPKTLKIIVEAISGTTERIVIPDDEDVQTVEVTLSYMTEDSKWYNSDDEEDYFTALQIGVVPYGNFFGEFLGTNHFAIHFGPIDN